MPPWQIATSLVYRATASRDSIDEWAVHILAIKYLRYATYALQCIPKLSEV